MRKYLFITISTTLFFLQLTAQKKLLKTEKDLTTAFDKYVLQSLSLWKTPGLSVAVVKDGKIVFKKAYGVTELGKPQPFTTATLSICASQPKP